MYGVIHEMWWVTCIVHSCWFCVINLRSASSLKWSKTYQLLFGECSLIMWSVGSTHFISYSYYNAAYTLVVELLDQRSTDDHLLELKIIGGIISYKVCLWITWCHMIVECIDLQAQFQAGSSSRCTLPIPATCWWVSISCWTKFTEFWTWGLAD